jgi:hypothetical protein
VMFKFDSGTFQLFYLHLVRLENHVYLSRGVQVADVAWWAATRIVARVGYLMQRIRDGRISRVLSDRTIRISGDAVCSLYRAHGDEEREFLG